MNFDVFRTTLSPGTGKLTFQEKHAEIYRQYAGQYVAMHDGVILDHDTNLATLHDRIRAHYGDAPILMTPVTAEPLPTYRILSPRLETPLEQHHDLDALAGTWSEEQADEFLKTTDDFE